MAHIDLPADMPGIRALMTYRPETALPISQLVEVLLQGPSTLTKGEREMIATRVSTLNECKYCASIHGAIARAHLGDEAPLVAQVASNPDSAPVSDKLKALLAIAGKVQEGGRRVSDFDVIAARAHGATDLEIHDTVLIAAVFCLCNRYVDGLATWAPDDPAFYRQRAALVAENGYAASTLTGPTK
jgi:uncharacterized peroxidase-related enzyme